MGSKGLAVTSFLLFISLFLPWQTIKGCAEAQAAAPPEFRVGCSISGFGGLGVLVAILCLAILAWEITLMFVPINLGTVSPALISAIAGGATVLFTLIKFLTSLGGSGFLGALGISWGAFVGLIIALAMAYASYLRFQESRTTAPPPTAPPPPGI
jgi:hypothetical protein